MSVLKVLEIMAHSNESWEDAAQRGIAKATQSVNGIKSAWVKDQSVTVKDDKVDEYRVTMKITFEVS
ncbi:MAG: dodecin family protein [Saprospiraceae bacterium]|nr:dodecin family protein [Saprospiraceae bacterium]